MQTNIVQQNLRHNFIVNVIDGAFFGLGLGFASSVTVIPLFINTLTDMTVLIGLVAALHVIGWQLPQLFTAGYVSRLRRYRKMVILMTIHERWPFFGLALVAAFVPSLGSQGSLVLAVLLLGWHSLGGGVTATAWQSLIGKIMPSNLRGTFFGAQSAAASLMAALGAMIAGALLEHLPSPLDFALCFLFAGLAMTFSWFFLAATREAESAPPPAAETRPVMWRSLFSILQTDSNFRWFLVARVLTQVSSMAVAFYVIYGVRAFSMGDQTAGVLAGVLLITKTIANPILGSIGDRWGHRFVLAAGGVFMAASAFTALAAPEAGWFYIVFGLAGIAEAVQWAITMAMTLDFGRQESDKPLYIGLSNTVVGVFSLGAPILGGWLADSAGFSATFTVAALCGLLNAFVLLVMVRDPRAQAVTPLASAALESA